MYGLAVDLPLLKNMTSSVGMIKFPTEWKHNKCSKQPTKCIMVPFMYNINQYNSYTIIYIYIWYVDKNLDLESTPLKHIICFDDFWWLARLARKKTRPGMPPKGRFVMWPTLGIQFLWNQSESICSAWWGLPVQKGCEPIIKQQSSVNYIPTFWTYLKPI